MKKFFSFMMMFALVTSFSVQAKTYKAATKSEFSSAWGAAGRSADARDTILVSNIDGQPINMGILNGAPVAGKVYIIGVNDENGNRPILQAEINLADSTDGNSLSYFIYNMNLQHRSGNTATSGQVFYANKVYSPMDSFVVRNCEITNIPRTFIRTVPKQTDGVYDDGGVINYFEMSNCDIHDMCITSGNRWPIIYFGQSIYQVLIENNSFYNMPFVKNLYTMNYIDGTTGVNCEFIFRNNSVMCAANDFVAIAPGSFMGAKTTFDISDNLFMIPDSITPLMSKVTKARILSISYGIIDANNNLVEGYSPWSSGHIKDENGEPTWVSVDTTNNYTMTDLEVAWTDFLDVENGDFSYLSTSRMATAGKNGGALGDLRKVLTLAAPCNMTATSAVEGAVITPAKGAYEKGSTVTVSASEVDGYVFKEWQVGGVKVSDANPYSFTIEGDMELVAVYEELMNREVKVTLTGSKTATYSIEPVKDVYYVGDSVTIFLNTHCVNEFLGWSDIDSKELIRGIRLTDNVNWEARFYQLPYSLVWDFDGITKNQKLSNYEANHYTEKYNKGVMNYVSADTVSADFQTRNNKFTDGDLRYCALRRTPAANFENPDYIFVTFSTKNFKNVRVRSHYASDNCIYTVQKMQYSLDGETYKDFASDTIKATTEAEWNQMWFELAGTLPAEADGQEVVYVRWIADPTSSRIKLESVAEESYEYFYLSQIVVAGEDNLSNASWRVVPGANYIPGDTIKSVNHVNLILGGTNNSFTVVDTTITINKINYLARLNASQNPKQGSSNPASDKAPDNGTFWKFDIDGTGEGILDVAVYVNANKTSFVHEDGVALADYDGFKEETGVYKSICIPVKSGSSYSFCSAGSKMALLGFAYYNATSLENKPMVAANVYVQNGIIFVNNCQGRNVQIFDVLGRRLQEIPAVEGSAVVTGLSNGLYLVRTGENEVVKVMVR